MTKILTGQNQLFYKKFLDTTKFKAVADDKFYIPEMMISLFDTLEIIEGKGENEKMLVTIIFILLTNASSTETLKV